MNLIEAPVITIAGPAQVRTITDAKGFAKQLHFQPATLETAQMRVQIDHEFDTPDQALAVGSKWQWDVTADLVPGRYGRTDLARRRTLRPLVEAKPAPSPKAA
ncbi:hypothetical protein RDV84_19300 [Lysobacter yananisis]|uniref:Uncharacterized protein n=1 Tax=Lysobacter yananisis TaxID=1003114 RepID=A0ABY9P4X8_9GAMM|nr:hypothetical protein [Lysobacter yananisis]WMT02090.1 hypothetical protein RDV84_19300 [Lysobacter yananisis]